MDGLAVGVVPRERAGMASGIFNTVRVAGEGIALALVGAALTALVAARLAHLPGVGTMASGSSAVSQAAQQVTTGGLQQALALLPGLDRAAVLQVYGDAFATLLLGLAAVTVLTAVVVFAFLRSEAPAQGAEAALNCPAS